MGSWLLKTEEELTLLIKDWLKAQNRTQADLKKSLNANSSRMPSLIEILKNEFDRGGMSYVVTKLCSIEKNWSEKNEVSPQDSEINDPFDQLDLILQDLKDKNDENDER